MKTKALLLYLVVICALLLNAIKVNGQWAAQSSGSSHSLRSVYFTDANTGYVCEDGIILKTIDGGANWTKLYTPNGNYFYSVYFTDANTGYVVGGDGIILKTINGGTNWSAQTSGTSNGLSSIYFTNATTGYIVGGGGIILKTINGGTSWTVQTSEISNGLTSVYFTDANMGYVVGSGGIILKTINGGTNWTTQTTGPSTGLKSIYFTDANTGYAVGGDGIILKTINGGTNWTIQTSGTTKFLTSVYFTDANNGYAVGNNGIILKTIDSGTNWTVQTSGTVQNLTSVYFTNANNGYIVGEKGIILKTNTGGWCTGIPGQPTGITSLCKPSGSYQYTTTGAMFATSYLWSLNPSSAGTISGTGLTSTVTWSGLYNGNVVITVQGVKSGCLGETSSVNIAVNNSGANSGSFSLSNPANGSWSSATPFFRWAASTGAFTYSLYIDGILKKDNIIGTSFQILPTETISSGMHTWYLISSNGCPIQSSETWSFRVDLTPPSAFDLIAPVDNYWTENVQPQFQWNPSIDAGSGLAKYQLWIDSKLNRDDIAPTETSTIPLNNDLLNGAHTWQIKAVDNAGNIMNSTQLWTFNIDNTPPVFANVNIQDISLYIYWNDEVYYDHYRWAIIDELNHVVLSDDPGSSRYTFNKKVSLLPGKYTFIAYASSGKGWYVGYSKNSGYFQITDAISGNGQYYVKDYGIDVNFTIGTNGNGIFSPSDKKYISNDRPTFNWNKAIDTGVGFRKFQLFVDDVLIQDNLADTVFTLSNTLSYGLHNWYVEAFDSLGNNSPVYQMPFIVDNAKPYTFNLTSPTNNQIVDLPTPNLSWQATTDSIFGSSLSKYQLWINNALNRDSIPISQTTVAPKNVLAQGAYSWYINAYDNVGNVRKSSQISTFYVDWEPPTNFTLVSPFDNQTATINRPTFVWHHSTDIGSGLNKYELNISGYSPIEVLPTDTTYTITFDLPNGSYSWFVKAYDLANGSTSSNTFTLKINVPLPEQPATPMGTDILCINPANTSYTTTGANYATSYVWTISPVNAGTTTGSGTTATVDWDNTFTGTAQITVKGHNNQGDGILSNPLQVNFNPLPSAALAPIGTTTMCINGANTDYSTVAVANATSYIWSISPANAGTITGNGISAIVDWNNTYSGTATIAVKGHNDCGDGIASTLPIIVNTKPSTPIIIQNEDALHSDAINGNQWYNQSGLINGAINQDYIPNSSGDYYVIVSNNCGSSSSSIINFILTGIEPTELSKSIKIYPNPVSDKLIIETVGESENSDFEIINSIGQVIYSGTLSETSIVNTKNFSNGIYIIKLNIGNKIEIQKIIKE